MRQFPVTAAMLIVLGGVLPLLMGGWLFLAGIVMPLPHLTLVLLAYGGCLLPFYGAMNWGFLACKPTIILPKGESLRDKRAILLGGFAFLWGWLAMGVGASGSLKIGFALEIGGFLSLILLERLANRHGDFPPGYFLVRVISSILCVIGFTLALLSPQGQF
ncbi:DUF3429 domain-containing protein [Bombella saccharophila]|uniref:DUF3429 domain-containing protein n=1 Tax=Bombella saccharophila TaxID=2967338 RepID=A0ABT3W5I5_9PROT|nr:DUF3429 domain-containing protein [Bombella saccharophila]MCX5614033.1 DUF3429 domain-containing protein [Bombella saccharophila]